MTKDFYRGKRVDNGEWVYGYLSKTRNIEERPAELKLCIDYEENGVMCSSIIIPETVGQCSGLLDKKRNPIFTGDICKGAWKTIFEVFWDKPKTSFQARTEHHSPNGRDVTYYANYHDGIIDANVIGNIHDNPELISVKHAVLKAQQEQFKKYNQGKEKLL